MLVGAHVSVAGGLDKAVERSEAIGANVMQIFVTSPRSFRTTDYSTEQIIAFKKLYAEKKMGGLFFHAVYLINLASEKESSVQLSIDSLVHYLQMGDKLGATGTIVHLGSYKDGDGEVLIAQVVTAIKEILKRTPESQKLLIENCAGKKIGKDLDELTKLHKQVGSDRVGFCIDTQHLFASGIDVRDTKLFSNWLAQFDENIGINNLVCIHANDSKTELGSGADRHENIGKGLIGMTGFKNILAQPLLQNKPFILEVPGEEQKGPDRENIERLRGLK